MRHAPAHPKICGALPCENDQAKPDRISRLARSTNLSKILLSYPPERSPLGSRPRLLRQGVLELVALTDFCTSLHLPAFLREPSKVIELSPPCQAHSPFRPRPLKLVVGGSFPSCEIRPAERRDVPFRGVAQRKISKSDQKNAPEPLRLAGDELLGRAMACSLWDSLQGFRGTCLT